MSNNLVKKLTSGILLFSIIGYSAMPVFGFTKEESVYSKIDSDGKVYQTTVSNHLKNTEKSEVLKDLSDLMNIEALSDCEYEKDNNTITWKSNGEDVYYEGNSEKELPIDVKIKYSLNGKEVQKEDIVGKSGNVKITYEFTNKESRKVNINGKIETMYVPFVVGVGTVIDNKNNKNIEITNGKEIDNGTKTMVFGIALPGMQESLGISKNDIELPNKVEITMDATNFEMNEIYCFASPKIIEENDLEVFDKLDKVYDMANELRNASSKLVDGSNKLSDGAKELNNGTNELSSKLNVEIAKYESARNELSNKKEIEGKIVKIINDELNKLMPEIEKEAENEAKNVIANHKEELETSVTEKSMEYTKKAINEKITEIQKKGSLLDKDEEKALIDAISKDIEEVLGKVENDESFRNLENAVKEAVIKEVKKTVGTTTKEVVNEQVDKMSKAGLTNTLTTEELSAMKTQMAPIVKEIATAKIQEKIQANATSKVPTLMRQGLSREEAMAKALLMAQTEITDADKLQAQNEATAQVMKLMESVSGTTLNKVKDNASLISDAAVDKTIENINKSTESEENLQKAIQEYKDAIAKDIAEIMQINDKETLEKIEKSIQNKIAENLKEKITNNEVIKKYMSQVKSEVGNTISSVANDTASDLAKTYTETIANEVAKNLIQKQLSGSLQNGVIDEEFRKYEKIINSKLDDVDSEIGTLKDALNQLTDGTKALADGANELANGMSKFDDEGIQKIYNLVNGNLKDVDARVEKLKELANEYKTFTMSDENSEGTVKFIMMIDGLNKETIKKEEAIIQTEVNEEKKEN